MQELRCKKCGLALEQRGDQYICPGCGAEYQAEDACRVADEMARLLDEQKQERVANLRQQLWVEFNEEFYNRAEISRLAKGIMAYLPDDFFAQFCDLATGRDTRRLNAFLYAADVKAQSMYIWDMLAFLLRPLREETLLAVNDLLARAGAAGLDMEGFRRCNEQLAREAEKLNAGVYDVTLPRDVFLAYSSADMAQVGELVEALEAQKISCFVAARNLQHGAIQNYEEQLRRAMDHCRTVVFVSSKNSRSRTCDALSTELPYIRERDIAAAPQYRNDYAGMPARYKKPRIEYFVDAHTHTAADAIVEEFFEGCEYCYDANTAAQRILGLLTSKPATAVKYCRSCGTENPVRAKLCLECGGHEFADTYEEYEQAQRAKAEQSAREAETVRRAEEEKKKAEEEAAALRAELEKLKKQAQAAAAKPAEQPAPALDPKPAPAPKPAPKPAPAASPLSDFEIENGVVTKYKGKGGDVVIPDGVNSIGDWAFTDCKSLTSITIPYGVTVIEWNAFNGCTGLKSVIIPSSVTSIGEGAFKGCTGLTSITIPNSVQSIGDLAFDGCTGLTSITIPDGVTSIGLSAFSDCTGLTSITIPNSVKIIGDWAFDGCTGLTSITIPNSVTNIGMGAFRSCDRLTSIVVERGNAVYHSDGNCLIQTAKKKLIAGCKASVIPTDGSVTGIERHTFDGCLGLTSITIPNGVTSIGQYAFCACKNLTSIMIPNSVRRIGQSAFWGCLGLTSITIPITVTKIEIWVFENCPNLKIHCHRKKPLFWPKGWDRSLKNRIIWDN